MSNLILISIICCFIVNSGAVDSLKRWLWRWQRGKASYQDFALKPLDCELCLTWWSCLGYLLIVGQLSLLTIAMSAIAAWITPVVIGMLNLIQDIPKWVIGNIYNKIDQHGR